MAAYQPRTVKLKNHKTGEEREFMLRPFYCGDEDAVIQCVSEEYGDTYYRREYYDKERLLELTKSGRLFLFLAYCGSEVCGIQSIVSYAPEETRLEAASQIFRVAYRGYGLPYELVKYTYEFTRSLKPSCIYASMVVFHDITQSMCELAGMKAVAFNFGSHITSKMHNSFKLGTSEKYAQAIMVLPVDKKDAGKLYVHPDIEKSVSRLYTDLGVTYETVTTVPDEKRELPDRHTKWDVSVNEREQSITVKIKETGSDLIDMIRDLKASHEGKYWTIQLILPVDEECAIAAYEKLKTEGFFYTGVRALCTPREQIFMQYIGDVYFCYNDFKLIDGFKVLLEDVLKHEQQ